MGYYTQHKLNAQNTKGESIRTGRFEEELEDECGACFEEPGKWYRQDEDMLEYSIRYPEYLFTIHCKGEEGEEYKTFYKNGKRYTIYPTVTWYEFNESLLT